MPEGPRAELRLGAYRRAAITGCPSLLLSGGGIGVSRTTGTHSRGKTAGFPGLSARVRAQRRRVSSHVSHNEMLAIWHLRCGGGWGRLGLQNGFEPSSRKLSRLAARKSTKNYFRVMIRRNHTMRRVIIPRGRARPMASKYSVGLCSSRSRPA